MMDAPSVEFVFCVRGDEVRLCRAVSEPADRTPGVLKMSQHQAALVEGTPAAHAALCYHFSYVLQGGDSNGGIYQFASLRPLSGLVRQLAIDARAHVPASSF